MLPMVVMRRLDCVLEPTKDLVLEKNKELASRPDELREVSLNKITGHNFHNVSNYTFSRMVGDPDNVAANLLNFIKGFSKQAQEIIEHFGFEEQIGKLEKNNRLFLVVQKFCEIDLHPDVVSNIEMGYIFEELIRKYNEASKEEAGDHFTPREVIRLMVNLLFSSDSDLLTKKGIIRTMYDPAAGTGGMLSESEAYLRELNPNASLELFGQDYNNNAFAICGSDMLIKGQNPENIKFGDSFTHDQLPTLKADYMLSNPPFGVEWRPQEDFVKKEHATQGYGGRFGAGLPPIDDGALLFLQHMIAKMQTLDKGGSRIAIVFNGSPLFTGSAESGPSNIRKWIIENDWLEAIVALPDQLFYNTEISTYIWIVTNRKSPGRKGKVQLIDGRTFFKKMRKSLGKKRHEICDDQKDELTRLYGEFIESEFVKIFDNEDFGYQRITVERPLKLNFAVTDERVEILRGSSAFRGLASSKKKKDEVVIAAEEEEGRKQQQVIISALDTLRPFRVVKNRDVFTKACKDAFRKSGVSVAAPVMKAILSSLSERDETANICIDSKGNPEPDSDIRDYENVPLKEDIDSYMAREVLPHLPDAWVNRSKTKIGYEINFNRYFYKYTPPRPLEEIEADLEKIEAEIAELLLKR